MEALVADAGGVEAGTDADAGWGHAEIGRALAWRLGGEGGGEGEEEDGCSEEVGEGHGVLREVGGGWRFKQ